MTQKKDFGRKVSIWVTRNAKFAADFEFVLKKVAKSPCNKVIYIKGKSVR
jgi:hypothetical protein